MVLNRGSGDFRLRLFVNTGNPVDKVNYWFTRSYRSQYFLAFIPIYKGYLNQSGCLEETPCDGALILMTASFSIKPDNKEDSPLINALSRHIGEYYRKEAVRKDTEECLKNLQNLDREQ